MKGFIILALLCVLSMQQIAVLISSSPSNTLVTSPAGSFTILEAAHTANLPGHIGYGAQWIYKNGTDHWPNGETASFFTQFYADCQSTATLIITADDVFSASLNGGSAFTGNDLFTVYTFLISNLKCGLNTLSINTLNYGNNSPAALIFAVIQDQSCCYNCITPLSFYNRATCTC
jgi:hypothetical protein